MGERYAVDTGFIVALLDDEDPDHAPCAEAWKKLRGEFFTVEGTLVEAAHLLGNRPEAVARAVALVRAVGTRVAPPSAARTDRALALMKKYRDVPMDYVDADLVACCEEQGLESVLTLDVRGFSAYRTAAGAGFAIVPQPTLRRSRKR